jgi:hypothetical protein
MFDSPTQTARLEVSFPSTHSPCTSGAACGVVFHADAAASHDVAQAAQIAMLQKQLEAMWLTNSALKDQVNAARRRAAERQAELSSSCESLASESLASPGCSFSGRRRTRDEDDDEFPTYRGVDCITSDQADPVYRSLGSHIPILRADSGPVDEFDCHSTDDVDGSGSVTWRSASFEGQPDLPAGSSSPGSCLTLNKMTIDLPALVECVAKLRELNMQGAACDEALLEEQLQRVMQVLG